MFLSVPNKTIYFYENHCSDKVNTKHNLGNMISLSRKCNVKRIVINNMSSTQRRTDYKTVPNPQQTAFIPNDFYV